MVKLRWSKLITEILPCAFCATTHVERKNKHQIRSMFLSLQLVRHHYRVCTKLVVRMCSVKTTNYIILFYSQKETETDNQILLWLYLLNLFKLIRCTTYLGVILTNWRMISKCSNVSTKWQVAILKCLFLMKSLVRSFKMQLRIHFTFYHVPSLKIK